MIPPVQYPVQYSNCALRPNLQSEARPRELCLTPTQFYPENYPVFPNLAAPNYQSIPPFQPMMYPQHSYEQPKILLQLVGEPKQQAIPQIYPQIPGNSPPYFLSNIPASPFLIPYINQPVIAQRPLKEQDKKETALQSGNFDEKAPIISSIKQPQIESSENKPLNKDSIPTKLPDLKK